LKNEFLGELQRMQSCLHRLIDHFTAISGYAQLVQFKPESSATHLDKIIHIAAGFKQLATTARFPRPGIDYYLFRW
jgi:hypothetical protein